MSQSHHTITRRYMLGLGPSRRCSNFKTKLCTNRCTSYHKCKWEDMEEDYARRKLNRERMETQNG